MIKKIILLLLVLCTTYGCGDYSNPDYGADYWNDVGCDDANFGNEPQYPNNDSYMLGYRRCK
jgi:hypothetical protein